MANHFWTDRNSRGEFYCEYCRVKRTDLNRWDFCSKRTERNESSSPSSSGDSFTSLASSDSYTSSSDSSDSSSSSSDYSGGGGDFGGGGASGDW